VTDRLAPLRLPSGGFAMVALDQRESLRTIIADRTGRPALDDDLRRFKVAAARALSPLASGILLDPDYGLDPVVSDGALAPGCGLIVAVDRLTQEPGGPVDATDLDDAVDVGPLKDRGVVALKLLVLWRRPGDARLLGLADRFVALAASAGLASVLEGIVRPDGGIDREDAIVAAARELGERGPDLYKAEVPLRGRGAAEEMTRRAGEITRVLPCPWVVLSNGVAAEDFERAVRSATMGGAAGFLAGRAVWTDSIEPDIDGLADRLATRAVDRLRRLREVVETGHGVLSVD
jgi:sulfofructosephosphate aldolase